MKTNVINVRLPWIEGHAPLPRNFNTTKKKLDRIITKLKENQKISGYNDVFVGWFEQGIIEEVPVSQWDEEHYLPHRPVYKEQSTTKVTPVFDASSKEQGGPSLNQCLEKGINLIEFISSILLRFRLHQIGVIADIKGTFLQISVNKDERDFLRFLWINEKGDMKIYRHTRVVFGVTSSPFLLGAVINLHLKKVLQFSKNKLSANTVLKLQKCFYVDNCVTIVDDTEELHRLISEATSIFAEAKFELRGWEYSDINLTESVNTPVLGLTWNRKEDTLSVSSCKDIETTKITRRIILSIAQQIFDPIGFSCPNSICPKLLLEKCVAMKGGWDEEVPDDIKRVFLKWLKELPILEEIKIPRWLRGIDAQLITCSIHTFCDASIKIYATAVFIRYEYDSYVDVQLIQAKSRIAPLKQMSIPRLELLAVNIGARLANSIKQEFIVEQSSRNKKFNIK